MDKDFENREVEIQLCNIIADLYKENNALKKELEEIDNSRDYWIHKCSELEKSLKKGGEITCGNQ